MFLSGYVIPYWDVSRQGACKGCDVPAQQRCCPLLPPAPHDKEQTERVFFCSWTIKSLKGKHAVLKAAENPVLPLWMHALRLGWGQRLKGCGRAWDQCTQPGTLHRAPINYTLKSTLKIFLSLKCLSKRFWWRIFTSCWSNWTPSSYFQPGR